MGLPYGENFIILTSTFLTVTDAQTDGQIVGWTDGRAIANSVLSTYAVGTKIFMTITP